MYSATLKTVFLLELTCGDDSNFEDQSARKEERYSQLLADIGSAGWTTRLFTFEVGCRGFYHDILPHLFIFFTIPEHRKKKVLNANDVAEIALRGSCTISLSRNNRIWLDKYNLVKDL